MHMYIYIYICIYIYIYISTYRYTYSYSNTTINFNNDASTYNSISNSSIVDNGSIVIVQVVPYCLPLKYASKGV